MLTYSINIFVPLSFIFFGLLVTEQGIAHPVQIPVYSKHCRDIKNRFGRVVGQECVERFSTKRKPPAFGFGHADINKFIAWDSMQVKHDPVEVSTNKVPPSIRTTLRTTTKHSTTSTTSTTTTTTTKRPIIEPNPEDNTNPDYENVFHPVSSTSTGSTPTEKEREEEKKIIDDVEDEYPDGDEEYPDESKETPEEKPETENKGTEEDEEEDYEYED